MTIRWSPQQEQAIVAVSSWYAGGGRRPFYLAGYAGTGKTTIAKHLVAETGAAPCYAAYTGKAAAVMRKTGCANAGTLHSKIYKFKTDETGRFTKTIHRGPTSPIITSDLIVVDECSMVDDEIGRALVSFGKPILVLGDPAQLPPVKGGGYFTAGRPDMMLTEIHRQAAENPIIRLATDIRMSGRIENGKFGTSAVVSRSEFREEYDITAFDQVLVGRNKTRQDYNLRLREIKGFDSNRPMVGEKVVCLKNDRDLQIFNGGMFTITETFDVSWEDPDLIGIVVQSDDDPEMEPVLAKVRSEFFDGRSPPHWEDMLGTQQFTYGYALTVHKAQGSQWDKVVVFDEPIGSPDDMRRWRYTAVTRAAESLVIVR